MDLGQGETNMGVWKEDSDLGTHTLVWKESASLILHSDG